MKQIEKGRLKKKSFKRYFSSPLAVLGLIVLGLLAIPLLLYIPFLLPKILSYIIIYGGLFALIYVPIHYIVKWKFDYTIPFFPMIWNKYFKKEKSSKTTSAEEFLINGKTLIKNPYAGVFISGGAGSGKSKSVIEPIIKEIGKKGYTGVIYDFKFPELAEYVNTAYEDSDVKTYYINFDDLNRSNRINPIAPELMKNESYAREFAYAILSNLNPQMITKPDFWSDNSVALLTSIFWYLKEVYPEFCTLPHAISMVMSDNLELLINRLRSVPKCADMVAPLYAAMKSDASNQVAGVVSSLQISLSKINQDELYYLLSESDFDLDLNNPQSKGVLVIGNSPTLASTYAPIIGLILTSVSKLLNQQGKEKSVFMLDEFPTVYVPNVEQLPATARSNKVSTILACQDISQIVDKYGKEKSETILSNLGNQFYGRTPSVETAKRLQTIFGTYDKEVLSESIGENYSYSLSEKESNFLKLQDLANLNTGNFYTILSEGKQRQGLSKIPMDKKFSKSEIFEFASVSKWDLDQAYKRIKNDVDYILGK